VTRKKLRSLVRWITVYLLRSFSSDPQLITGGKISPKLLQFWKNRLEHFRLGITTNRNGTCLARFRVPFFPYLSWKNLDEIAVFQTGRPNNNDLFPRRRSGVE
jgi:hypothetical protein